MKTMGRTTGTLLLLLGLLAAAFNVVKASDPDLTTDFGLLFANVSDFTFKGFSNLGAQPQGQAKPNFANPPGLNGLGLAAVVFEFGAQSQIDPHTHPRGTEIFYVTSGTVDVGFVDTNNDLFETTLYTGDLFIFPKGLLHWQRNNQWGTASGFSALSSENPGNLFISDALFSAGAKGLPDNVLASAFSTTTAIIDGIKAKLGGSPN
jgi:quercetin dioxygenase-like cupin family protein